MVITCVDLFFSCGLITHLIGQNANIPDTFLGVHSFFSFTVIDLKQSYSQQTHKQTSKMLTLSLVQFKGKHQSHHSTHLAASFFAISSIMFIPPPMPLLPRLTELALSVLGPSLSA